MKKNSLIKAIVGIFVAYVILSWIIPAGAFSGGKLTTDGTAPVGLIDLIRYPIITCTSSIFVLASLVILCIGGFYAVLNRTGVYGKVVEGIAKKFKGKEFNFIVIAVLILGVLSSLTALTLPLFILVPFLVAVLMKMGRGKLTALLSTVGAILVGNMASTYGFNINGYIKYFLNVDLNATILYRAIFFVLSMVVLLFTISKINKIELKKKTTKKTTKEKTTKGAKTTKKAEKNEEVKEEYIIPLYEGKIDKKKSATPMIVITILMMIVILVSMFNWSTGLQVNFFNDIYESINSFEINGYPIFKNLIGTVDPIGYWSNYELAFLLVVASLLLGWVYNIKFTELVETFIDGAKRMGKVAVYVLLANVIFLAMNSSATGLNIFATIANFFLELTDKFNVLTMMLTGLFGGIFYNDFPYMLNALYSQVQTVYTQLPLIGLILQYMHGFMMLLLPTSTILVAGLTYLDIPYVDYLKKIWKYLLMLLAASIIVLVIAMIVL